MAVMCTVASPRAALRTLLSRALAGWHETTEVQPGCDLGEPERRDSASSSFATHRCGQSGQHI